MNVGRAAIAATVALTALVAPAAASAVPGDLDYQGCITGNEQVGPSGSDACAAIPAAAGTLSGQYSGLDRLESIAVSPDGASVYVVAGSWDDAIASFDRDPSTGAVTYAGCLSGDFNNSGCFAIESATAGGTDSGLNHPESVAVSPDGRSVYVTSRFDDAISHFARDLDTGALSYVGCDSAEDQSVPPCDPIGAPDSNGTDTGFDDPKLKAAVVSPDGRFVYAVGAEDDSVVTFDRSTSTGELSFASCLTGDSIIAGGNCDAGPTATSGGAGSGLSDPRWLTLSPDGAHLYLVAARDATFVHFSRNASSGALTFEQCVTGDSDLTFCDQAPEANPAANGSGFANPRAFALSPDGEFAYGTGSNDSAVLSFDRDPDSGGLVFDSCLTAAEGSGPGGTGACSALPNSTVNGDGSGFDGMRSMATSTDGVSLYIAAQFDSALVNFDLDPSTGALSLDSCITGDTDVACDEIASATPGGIESGLWGLETIALSPDDSSLYGAAEDDDAVSHFAREPVPAPPPAEQGTCRGATVEKTDGSAGNDTIVGTAATDLINGLGGADNLDGAAGADCVNGDQGKDVAKGGAGRDNVRGGAGRDKVKGADGKDKLKGGGGKDRVAGGGGKDKLKGDAGKDKLKGGGGKDKLKGGAGRDKLRANDGKRDRVNCGGGKDRAAVDERDKVARNCERVSLAVT